MTNHEKAAILMLSLDEELAAKVMKNLKSDEVKHLGISMNGLTGITNDDVERVARDFCTLAQEKGTRLVSFQGETIHNIMVKALGEDKAKQVLDMIEEESFRSHHSPVIDKLRDIDPRVLIDFTKMEHPQTIALILAHLRPEQTAEILENLPEEKQTDITRRIATLNSVPGEFIEEMEKALESELILGETGEQSFGGVDLVADILNKMNRSSENAILESLDETNPDLSAEIRELMFTFDDVLQLDDRAIRELLQEVSSEDLALAIKVADESMQEKVFKNMSKRAADMLREDIELMPPTRLSVIEESQKRIVETTKRLESEGKITVVTGAGEDKLV